MKTFIDAAQLDEVIDDFVREGWLVKQGSGDDAQLTLTDTGKSKREAIFKLQSEVRQQTRKGITDEEYMLVIDVLQRMARNLE
jgi:DNA-binding MarR family transcriptional regulator